MFVYIHSFRLIGLKHNFLTFNNLVFAFTAKIQKISLRGYMQFASNNRFVSSQFVLLVSINQTLIKFCAYYKYIWQLTSQLLAYA